LSFTFELTDFKQEVAVAGSVVVESGGGYYHSCLLDDNQNVKCSGYDVYGQVGDGAGSSGNVLTFTTVSGLDAASTIAVGEYHSCAMISEDASIYCWGYDAHGALGTGGSGANVFTPGAAPQFNTGMANVQLIASGSTTFVDISN
jgi:alpha-tubulin suppressor-like RCC1 family protein